MEIFQFTKSYTFLAPKGRKKRFFFKLIERCFNQVTFVFYEKGDTEFAHGKLSMDGDTEVANCHFNGVECTVRADEYIPKGYRISWAGRLEEREDHRRDAYLDKLEKCGKLCYATVAYHNLGGGVPMITLVLDKLDEAKPTECSPYIWAVKLSDGSAVDVNNYTPKEAPEKLRAFLSQIPAERISLALEAVYCFYSEVDFGEPQEAIDAIGIALPKYFEAESSEEQIDAMRLEELGIDRNMDFRITTRWNGDTNYFTLLSNGEFKRLQL